MMAARVAGVDAALPRLEALAREGAPAPAVAALRRRHRDRRAQFAGTASVRVEGSPVLDSAAVQLQLNDAERAEIAALHLSDQLHGMLTMGRVIAAADPALRCAADALRDAWRLA